jgi:nucleotide-binding universal stress UspA family protein
MSQRIDSVLLPIDGSENVHPWVQRGIDIAATLGADLHVLAVMDVRELDPSLSNLDDDDRGDREQQIETEIEQTAESVAGRARTHLSSRIRTAVERGIPAETITGYADSHGTDLIVMGSHGRGGLERALLGSVTERVLRTTSVPVIVIPRDDDDDEQGDGSYEDILLPTDGSENADVAVEWGIDLAGAYDATIHTVYSVDTSRFAGIEGTDDLYDAIEETGQDVLESIRRRARAADVSVAATIGSGPAAQVLLSYSEDHDIDMIVMGTHGRSGIERYVVGSVTETVVRNADVPVCCVPMAEL